MYKVKEFEDAHWRSDLENNLSAVDKINKFIEENNINNFEVVEYSTVGADNEHGVIQKEVSILIKYWED